nr:MAG TPA: hypothetical protein [Caudoviricetes sp.]
MYIHLHGTLFYFPILNLSVKNLSKKILNT